MGVADTKAPQTSTPTKLTAAEIVEKNVAARGGLQAWRTVQTMSMTGQMEAGGNDRPASRTPGSTVQQLSSPRPADQVKLPFVLDLKRGRKQRIELQFKGETALQVYDGANGWKLRPYLNRLEVEPFTAEELRATTIQSELDGPLVDYASKGTKIELAGTEQIEGRDTYKLKLIFTNGQTQHVWIDAATFLESRFEGTPRRLDGAYHPVYVYYRDFRPVYGLMVPFLLETRVELEKPLRGSKEISEKIVVDEVVVNPKLEESLFSRPNVGSATSQSKAPVGGHSQP